MCVATLARAEHVVSVGGFTTTTVASFNASPLTAGPSVDWLVTLHPHVGVGAGLRFAPPSVSAPLPVEFYVRGAFTASFGPWEPMLGPELGVSGLMGMAHVLPGRATELATTENAVTGPLYVAFHLEALRFAFGRFLFNAAGVQVGTSLVAAGAVLRLQLEVVSVGVRF